MFYFLFSIEFAMHGVQTIAFVVYLYWCNIRMFTSIDVLFEKFCLKGLPSNLIINVVYIVLNINCNIVHLYMIIQGAQSACMLIHAGFSNCMSPQFHAGRSMMVYGSHFLRPNNCYHVI